MITRKNMGRASPILMVLFTFGFAFGTYNLVMVVIRNRSVRNWVSDDSNGGVFFDPVVEMPENVKKLKNSKTPYHVALTATDAPYSKWQCRIMYYWYKKKKDLPGSEMGGFTRILHSGNPDELMDEIPTMVVDPLPAGLDRVSFSHLVGSCCVLVVFLFICNILHDSSMSQLFTELNFFDTFTI